MQSQAAEVITRCRQLAEITDVAGTTTRLFLSSAAKTAHVLLGQWMQAAGLEVRIDDAGNLRGIRHSALLSAPTFLLFSHIDTVPDAGAFDGVLGVVLGLAVIESFRDRPLPFSIELIAFSEEEGIRFSLPFIGSRAVIGELASDDLDREDSNRISLASAIREFDLDPTQIPVTCPLRHNTFAALEVHIEQGPILEDEDRSIAVVTSVAGQTRLGLTFEGRAGHAGATPMELRRDALTAAAWWLTEVETYAAERDPLVATVGRIEVLPGAVNVIPGIAHVVLDVRHPDDGHRHFAVAALLEKAEAVAALRGIRVQIALQSDRPAVDLDERLSMALLKASAESGHSTRSVFSGAGHDAMILAPHVPTTMLFVRSPEGLSHHPHETVRECDVEAALATVKSFVEHLSRCDVSTFKKSLTI